jgi:hypothetical protein
VVDPRLRDHVAGLSDADGPAGDLEDGFHWSEVNP